MSEELKEIEDLLAADLQKETAANQRKIKIGGILVAVVAGYLLWVSSAIGTLLDPEGLAQAASGVAITAVPEAAKDLRVLVIDGAPDLVRMGSDQLVGMIPHYRQVLQAEIDPVLDQVSSVLAEAAMEKMAEQAGNPSAKYADDAAMQAAADAAVATIDDAMNLAMDTEGEDHLTPRQQIEASLTQLKKIDTELARIANTGGDPAERELLLAWMNVLTQRSTAETEALAADYKAGVRVPD